MVQPRKTRPDMTEIIKNIFCNKLLTEDLFILFLLLYGYLCSMSLPYGDVGLSLLDACCISWSYIAPE